MLNERFIELLSRKLSSELNAEELQEFRGLMAEDVPCRELYTFFKEYWKQKDDQYANSELMFSKIKQQITAVPETIPVAQIEHRPFNKVFYILLKGVAAVLILGLCAFGIYKYAGSKQQVNVLAALQNTSTPAQSRSEITLTDGTKVTLNAESNLKYPPSFEGATREVYLTGEAFFDVHKDHKHPFIIHTRKMNVRVLGTAFNVKAYPKDATTETTLIRGAIEVTLADRPSDRIFLKPNEKLILKNDPQNDAKPARRQALIADDTQPQYTLTTLTYYKSNDTSVLETAWLKNKLIFRNEDFSTLAERMRRWYGVNIIFENNSSKLYRFNGIFENETVNQALDALRMTENFHYKIQNSNVYIY